MYRPSPSRPPSIRSRSKLADDRIELYHPTGSPVFGGRTISAADKRAASRASRASGRTSPTDTLSISDESLNLGHVESHIEDINAPFGLRELEMGWQFFQPYLKSKGYILRPRYWPGWIGSWVGTDRDPLSCEDSIVVVRIPLPPCPVLTPLSPCQGLDRDRRHPRGRQQADLIKVHTPLAPPAAAFGHWLSMSLWGGSADEGGREGWTY
ncbi:hypothetical protein EWM64_g2624 [Hericium alpestre]|uniref:Uncharacterized protein n=1 Tax=Hericium alpestre TaxID=135208 RepID=A0A4Z0A657_9AGAM|nr:hypothetical protein EWM64_g2624 [Hericium alpestre]